MKKYLVLALALVTVLLSSCSVLDSFFSGIGYDTHDYSVESVIGKAEEGSEKWKEICEMLRILPLDSIHLEKSEGMRDLVSNHKESLLNYMLSRNFEMYAGNSSVLDEINESHPDMNAVYAIPKEDYESEAYRYFGGNIKITHSESPLFAYLEDYGVYVPATGPVRQNIDIRLISADETENTFKLEFSLSSDDRQENYRAIIVKRDDGTMYFKAIMPESEE